MACGMDNMGNGYTCRNIYILSDSQAAMMTLDSFHINSQLVWDCPQSLVKLAAHNMIQLVWVPLHMGTEGNKTADHILISTSMNSACLWHIYKGCHGSDQGLEEQETPGIWAFHSWTKPVCSKKL